MLLSAPPCDCQSFHRLVRAQPFIYAPSAGTAAAAELHRRDSVKGIRSQYNGLEAINQETTRIKEIKDVKETHYGAAPKSFNQYANSNDHVLTCGGAKQL